MPPRISVNGPELRRRVATDTTNQEHIKRAQTVAYLAWCVYRKMPQTSEKFALIPLVKRPGNTDEGNTELIPSIDTLRHPLLDRWIPISTLTEEKKQVIDRCAED